MANTPAQRMMPPMKLPGSKPPFGFGKAVVAGLVGVTGGLLVAVDDVVGGNVVGASVVVTFVAGSVVTGSGVTGSVVAGSVMFGAGVVEDAVVGASVVADVTVVVTVVELVGGAVVILVGFSLVVNSTTLLLVGLPSTVHDTVEKNIFFTDRGKMQRYLQRSPPIVDSKGTKTFVN